MQTMIIGTTTAVLVFTDVSHNAVASAAATAGFTTGEVQAGLEFADRKSRRSDPPGDFDNAGRFYADEWTHSVATCRSPSRAYPYPEMTAARTAAHCAEVIDADSLLAVRRVGRARDALDDFNTASASAHEKIEALMAVRRILKPVKR